MAERINAEISFVLAVLILIYSPNGIYSVIRQVLGQLSLFFWAASLSRMWRWWPGNRQPFSPGSLWEINELTHHHNKQMAQLWPTQQPRPLPPLVRFDRLQLLGFSPFLLSSFFYSIILLIPLLRFFCTNRVHSKERQSTYNDAKWMASGLFSLAILLCGHR